MALIKDLLAAIGVNVDAEVPAEGAEAQTAEPAKEPASQAGETQPVTREEVEATINARVADAVSKVKPEVRIVAGGGIPESGAAPSEGARFAAMTKDELRAAMKDGSVYDFIGDGIIEQADGGDVNVLPS